MKKVVSKIKKEKQNIYDNQIVVIYASFYYFAAIMQQNNYKYFTPKLKAFFHKLGLITKIYEKKINQAVKILTKTAKKWEKANPNKRIDYMLTSISIIAVYYEQTKGKKRLFYPFSNEQIINMQDECIELIEKQDDYSIVNNTFSFCEYLVEEMLR